MDEIQRMKGIINILGTVVGAGIMAFGTSSFLLPNQLSSGGLSGIATITYYLFKFPLGTTMLILNIPLLIIAFFKIGKHIFKLFSSYLWLLYQRY